MNIFKKMYKGSGYLEGYGDHPGKEMLIMFCLMGGLAGVGRGGLNGFIGGFIIMLVPMGLFFLIGCVHRYNAWTLTRYYEEE